MLLTAVAFYIFASILIASAVLVIGARNPVHSVFFLILAFFNAAGLFVLAGAEFLAMILVIVYVGAVAVLFMFVVMMLDINFARLREGFLQYLPVGALVGLILLVELIFIVTTQVNVPEVLAISAAPTPAISDITNTDALGRLIYTHYIYLFQAGGLILLVAMIGAIVLTLRERPGVRKQRIADQVGRRRDESVEIRKITPGSGI
ncbi:MAG: NADH-quinone oxidoreductase subunit J [Alphaproteobacteria bacterium]